MTTALTELPSRLPDIRFRQAEEYINRDPGFHAENLKAGLMALPDSTEQVSRLLAYCNENGIPVVAQGGRTGLSGAAVTRPAELILDTSGLCRISNLDPLGATVIAQAGVTLADLEAAANGHGLSTGIDLAARDTATIGGMAATNAGGIEAFRRGVMRNRILGLEVVLADGSVINSLKRVSKANEGLDVTRLLVGSEGVLGIITRISLSLVTRDPPSVTALCLFADTGCAAKGFATLRDSRTLSLLSAEAMWPAYFLGVADALSIPRPLEVAPDSAALPVLLEAAVETEEQGECFEQSLMDLLQAGLVQDIVIARNERERRGFWRIREDSMVVDNLWPHGYWYDVSVPLDSLSAYVDSLHRRIGDISSELQAFLIAHLGDGNIHATISAGKPVDALKDAIDNAVYLGLAEIGGSFSAEHGIGIDKKAALKREVSSERYQLMQRVRAAFDPKGILNPGKVL